MTEHRIDILINRIIDKVETPQEWAEFRAAAATEPSAWELLAEAQRDNERLVALAREATNCAERVVLPADDRFHVARASRQRWAGAGWLAAAGLLVAWITTGQFGLGTTTKANVAGAPMPQLTADAAFSQYLDKGRADGIVVGEIDPKVLLATTPLDAGGFEVVFVRQVVERREVPTLVQFRTVDESGAAKPTIVHPNRRHKM